MKDRYNKLATILYDINNKKDDILFYLNYAKKLGGEVLELGCGTGRVSIPLVEYGIKVTAIDLSQNMIRVLKEKTKNLENKENLKVVQANLTKIKLNKKFNLVIMPFRVFQCLLGVDEQQKALCNIKRHLTPNGLLIFDIYYPNFKILSDIPSREKIDFKYIFRNKHIVKSHINRNIDILNQIVTTDIIYYEYFQGKKKIVSKNTIKMRYSFIFEVIHLLKLNGFYIKQLLSDYKSKGFVVGGEMIFVCGKAKKKNGQIDALCAATGALL